METDVKAKYQLQHNDSTISLQIKSKEQGYIRYRKLAIVIITLVILIAVVTTTTIVLLKNNTGEAAKLKENIDHSGRKISLLVSLDGFRAEYLTRGITPNLDKLASNGVRANFLRPAFPPKTFTNHYTIATGLYPESNGMVANNFYDPDLKDNFKIGPKAGESKWWLGEPIWVTANKSGLNTASFYWVGSEAEIKGIRPTFWKKFDASVPWSARVNQVIDWMKLPVNESRPEFITLYFEEPDKKGHKYGPLSPQVTEMIKKADQTIGDLMSKMHENSLDNQVNVIVVSDHGMAEVDCRNNVTLVDKTNTSLFYYQGLGSFSMLNSKDENDTSTIYNNLRCSSKNLNIYSKINDYMPKRFHFTNSRRIGDVTIVPNAPWSVILKDNGRCYPDRGSHGFDNLDEDMKAIFVASGPSFKEGYQFDHLFNIEIYNLLTDLLKISGAPNNGTQGSLRHLLHEDFLASLIEARGELEDVKADEVYDVPQRRFPEDYEKALEKCDDCKCPYCNRNVSAKLDHHRKNLNLTKVKITESHQINSPLGLPKTFNKTSDLLLTQRHYITGYNTKLHIPMWVAYRLTEKQLLTNVKRSNCFRKDIRLTDNETSSCDMYYKSGMDRGHMAPSGDFNFDVESEQDTNVLSNIAPQYGRFNRFYGAWYYLENATRRWALKYKQIYVYSGSIFDMNKDGIKDEEDAPKIWAKNVTGSVAIPTHYYKMVVRCHDNIQSIVSCDDLRILTYILPHNQNAMCEIKLHSMSKYVNSHISTVRDLELLSGLKFFSELSEQKQARIKTTIDLQPW
ncbi:venom phosphodiesterase 2-like [Clytia hemisphaerica]|uniref:Uncharacterized protein n=2 Tax=Clytia hemisphaerica TaxID=252671 RepID=A0A7M5XKQ1_9CNID